MFQGGFGGNNLIYAGDGAATVTGGGNGDQLFAGGSTKQVINAGSGNETLSGVLASGNDLFKAGSGSDEIDLGAGRDTVVAGSGSATVNGGTATDVFRFVFQQNSPLRTEVINGFKAATDTVNLVGYQANEGAERPPQTRPRAAGSTTITLSDRTQITFAGVTDLKTTNFT